MRRIAAAALLVVAALAPVRAPAFVRSTTCTNDPRKGQCLWWSGRSVVYSVNMSGFATNAACTTVDAAHRLVDQSSPTWSRATRSGDGAPCTDLALPGASTSNQALGNDGTNLVVFRQGLCQSIADADCQKADLSACIQRYNCWSHGSSGGIIALTLTTFRPSTGEILDADMELHGWNGLSGGSGEGWYFTCDAPTGSVSSCAGAYDRSKCMDVGNTVTHEAGHVLGLDHECAYAGPPYNVPCIDSNATMAQNANPGETHKRVLTQDDVNGVCTIYPAGGSVDTQTGCLGDGKVYDSTDCVNERPAGQSSAGGCGAGGAGLPSLAAALVALGRIRGRRRARQRTTAPA